MTSNQPFDRNDQTKRQASGPRSGTVSGPDSTKSSTGSSSSQRGDVTRNRPAESKDPKQAGGAPRSPADARKEEAEKLKRQHGASTMSKGDDSDDDEEEVDEEEVDAPSSERTEKQPSSNPRDTKSGGHPAGGPKR